MHDLKSLISHHTGDCSIPAGRPSNWEEQRQPSFAGKWLSFVHCNTRKTETLAIHKVIHCFFPISGRRSRRNSFSEESQLTIENFGGSQDQLHMLGMMERDRERKISSSASVVMEPAVAVRSSIADARGTLQIGFDSDSEKQDKDTEKTTALKRQSR